MAKDKDAPEGDAEEGGKKGGKMKLILIIAPVVLLLIGGGLYFFVFSGSSDTSTSAAASGDGSGESVDGETTDGETTDGEATDSEASPSSTYVAGAVVTVEAVTINLASGHFLKVGLAMQATADAGEEVTTGKAADALITEFSGKTVDELATLEGREAAKKELLKAIKKAYEKKVYEIYYTSFVMN
jgi:flagellar FliL protein